GLHDVDIRARRSGTTGAWTSVSTTVDVPVAPLTPTAARVRLVRDGNLVRALTRSEASLEPSWAKDGAWSAFGDERALQLSDLDGVRRLSLQGRDEAGNLSRIVTIDLATRAWRVR